MRTVKVKSHKKFDDRSYSRVKGFNGVWKASIKNKEGRWSDEEIKATPKVITEITRWGDDREKFEEKFIIHKVKGKWCMDYIYYDNGKVIRHEHRDLTSEEVDGFKHKLEKLIREGKLKSGNFMALLRIGTIFNSLFTEKENQIITIKPKA